jgi:DNA-binding NarL/FixJ family response regulator
MGERHVPAAIGAGAVGATLVRINHVSQPNGALRVVVVAEEQLAGRALAVHLAHSKLVAHSSYAGSLEECQKALSAAAAHAVIWFGRRADRTTLEAIDVLRDRAPTTAVCVIAEDIDASALRAIVGRRADRLGVMLRSCELDILTVLSSLREIVSGRTTVSPQVLEQLAAQAEVEDGRLGSLDAGERSVLRLLSAGLRNCEIARRLDTSEKLVERRITRIFSKLGLRTDSYRDFDRRVMAARMFMLGGVRDELA